jgi:RNA polymerase sigma-70 factor (ECF subfamily)
MTNAEWSVLRDALLESYDDLMRRLTRRLRSSDLAHDALQDTYLRIERGGRLGPVDHPRSYLLRIAVNFAYARQRADRRLLTAAEIDVALQVIDEKPDPAQAAELKSELAALDRALEKLPKRRRAIFLAAWQDGLSPPEIAKRFGISTRTVYVDLKLAQEFCSDILDISGKK